MEYFFEKKAPGRVRLITGKCVVNIMLTQPPSVSLTTSDGFFMVGIELTEDIDPYSEQGRKELDARSICLGACDLTRASSRVRMDRALSV